MVFLLRQAFLACRLMVSEYSCMSSESFGVACPAPGKLAVHSCSRRPLTLARPVVHNRALARDGLGPSHRLSRYSCSCLLCDGMRLLMKRPCSESLTMCCHGMIRVGPNHTVGLQFGRGRCHTSSQSCILRAAGPLSD